jgi:hypothetical protein
MESDLKNYNKSSVRDIVYHNLLQKQKLMTKSTFTSIKKKYVDIMNNKNGSKAFLIKLNKEIDDFKVLSNYKKEEEKPIKKLTSGKLKEIKKEIKEQNAKIKSTVGQRTKYDKKALGDVFKKSYITDDLNYPLPYIFKRIQHRLEDELDKNNKKYNLITYIIILYQVRNKTGEKVQRYFHSDTMYITSKNIIKDYMEETKTNFLNKLDATENDSSLVFDKINEIQISTARNKAISVKS